MSTGSVEGGCSAAGEGTSAPAGATCSRSGSSRGLCDRADTGSGWFSMRPLCVFSLAATAALPVASSPACCSRGTGTGTCTGHLGAVRRLRSGGGDGRGLGRIRAPGGAAGASGVAFRPQPLDVGGEQPLGAAGSGHPREQALSHLIRIGRALLDGRRTGPLDGVEAERGPVRRERRATRPGSRRRMSASVRSRAIRSSSRRRGSEPASTRAASTSAATDPATASRSARASSARTAPRAISAAITPATMIASAGITASSSTRCPAGDWNQATNASHMASGYRGLVTRR